MGWDIVLRTAGAGTLLLTALVLLRSAPRAPLARWFLPFALGLSGFLGVNTAYDAAELPEPLWALASFCSRMAVVFVWLFCVVLFDGRPPARALAWTVGGVWLALVVVSKGYFASPPAGLDLSAIQIALGAGLLLHAAWRALRDLRDDLVEPRRRARPVFALALLVLVASDFAIDLRHGYDWRPEALLLLQNGAIVAIAAGLALWLLRADPVWTAAVRAAPGLSTPEPASDPAPDPDAAVLARLEAFMRDERPWLDAELTIAGFAARLGVPEPTLRRVINHRLGHGHFRSFLNEHRVEEAKRRLRMPGHGDKMIAVALDSGFASLASFNRVFRQSVGCTPGDYRAGAGPDPRIDGK